MLVRRAFKRCLENYTRCFSLYTDQQHSALTNPTEFWAQQAEKLIWSKKWDQVIDTSNPPFTKWYDVFR